MKIRTLVLLTILLSLGCHNSKTILSTPDAGSSVSSQEVNPDIELIDYLFRDYDQNNPGTSFIIIKNGKIALSKSYGYADIYNSVPATPNTNYRIASVSKQFTAIAVMMLIHQGMITYETTLPEIFPGFPIYGNKITIRHLLTHRSGLVDYSRFIVDEQQILDADILVGLMKTDSTYFSPGTQFSYSNTGYAVLAQVVEKISGKPFSEFMQEEIFNPLGMTNTTLYDANKKIKNRAFGYIVENGLIMKKDQNLTSAVQGDGSIYSSVMDFYKWDQALYSDKLMPQSEIQEAFYAWDENGKSDKEGYGYGWQVSYHNGTKILRHTGASTGFIMDVIRIPDNKLSVAIFKNRNQNFYKGKNFDNISKTLIALFSDGAFPIPIEVIIEKEMAEKGIDQAFTKFHHLKSDTINYSISKKSLSWLAHTLLDNNQTENALPFFKKLMEDHPNYYGENKMNDLGYNLLSRNRNQDAIKIFQLIVDQYPDHANPYDSLGEAYLIVGKNDLAIENYKKSVALDPTNINGINILKKLQSD